MIPGSTAGLGKLLSLTLLPGVGILTWWTVGTSLGQVTSPTTDSAPVFLVILGILSLIGLNGLFVMSSVAIESIRPFLIRHSKDHDEAGYRRLERLMDEKAGYVDDLAVVIFPHTGTTVGFLQLLSAALIIAIPTEIINLIMGELVPKSIASLHPIRTATRLYGFLTASRSVLVLFTFPVEAVANSIARRFGGTATFSMPNQTEEEIKNLVESAEQSGEIERDERELLHSVFSFTDTIAREVMTPRVDLDAVSADTPAEELVQLIKESGHSRIPIYEGTDDQIVGIIHAKDLLMAMLSGKPVSIRGLMRAPYFVPENKNLQQLLSELRTNRAQMAIIQDEFGGTSGIVTIEDIVEELVGDIVDEYDEEEPSVLAKDNGWSVEGRTHWEDLNRAIGSEFESEEFDTIGGYVFGLFGRQPSSGETMDVDGWRFTITETDGRRISRLHVELIPEATEEPVTSDLAYG